MGAVQKLATVVIVGLVGLATLLVVYLANEPNRRAAEAADQKDVAIERGVQTFIQNCVVCHGPAGEGYSEPGAKGTGRIGMPLGGNTEAGKAATARNQTTNPTQRQQRYDLIVKTINEGRGLMPAWGSGAPGGALLNDEQIYELATMIQNVDWNHVYNETIATDGGYPTFPPAPAPAGGAAPTPAPSAAHAAPASGPITIDMEDIFFQPKDVTIPAGQDVKVTLKNLGASPHNFSIDALKISQDVQPGETKEITINAPAGTYQFYCNVPGHKEAGMVGTLTAKAGAAAPAAAQQPEPAAAAQTYTVTAHDIYFDPKELTIPANTDVTIHLPNEGASPHDFSIDALKISVALDPGETDKTVVINAPPGDYEYYCNVPGHKEAGMVGTLHVVAGAGGQAAAQQPVAQQAAAPTTAAAAPAAAQTYTVTAHDIYFDPKELTIPANTDVTIHLPNDGASPHDFSIDALKISVALDPGETDKTVVINAPPGTYEYYCNVPGHKEAGMVGTLTVK
ncbi:MAG TPA: cupredoxin domain-containing protein [Thermomicrobiales bacterium]|nr:cupredoxin domain-containing protein [Thermomicrobiales bacterium]